MECPNCKNQIDDKVFFCPICGSKVKEKPVSTAIRQQIYLYLVSGLLPPLFLARTLKYIKSPDPKAKKIGWISLAIMITALTIGIWWAVVWAKNFNNSLNQEMDKYLNF